MSMDNETLSQFLDTLDRFVRERLIPCETEVAENDAIPQALAEEIRNMGLFGMSIPEAFWWPRPDHVRRGKGGIYSWSSISRIPISVRHEQRHWIAGYHH